MKKFRRQLALLLLCTMILYLVTACGVQEKTISENNSTTTASAVDATTKEEAKDPAKSGEKVTISTYMITNDWAEAGDLMIAEFMSTHPDIIVDNTTYSNTDGSAYLVSKAAVNDLPDIIGIDVDEAGWSIVNAGLMMDLSELEVAKHISDSLKATYTDQNGNLFGIALGFATSFMYYNKQMFADAGYPSPPQNIEELFDLCNNLKANEITPIGLAGMHATVNALPLDGILGNALGPEGVDVDAIIRDGDLDLNSGKGFEAIERLEKLSTYFQTGVAGTDAVPACDLLVQEKVAMVLAGSWSANYTAGLGDDLGVMLPPFNEPNGDNWVVTTAESAFGITNTNTDEASVDAKVTFFEWFWQPENYKYCQNSRGNIPSIDNAVDVLILDQISEILPDLLSAPAVTMNFAVYSTKAQDIMQRALQELYIGSIDAVTAASTITDGVQSNPNT